MTQSKTFDFFHFAPSNAAVLNNFGTNKDIRKQAPFLFGATFEEDSMLASAYAKNDKDFPYTYVAIEHSNPTSSVTAILIAQHVGKKAIDVSIVIDPDNTSLSREDAFIEILKNFSNRIDTKKFKTMYVTTVHENEIYLKRLYESCEITQVHDDLTEFKITL